ncbi:class I SAM-dependent methyltransferase [bacterium]|nr:class I SAM-dependent methyltransferase [bacterium]
MLADLKKYWGRAIAAAILLLVLSALLYTGSRYLKRNAPPEHGTAAPTQNDAGRGGSADNGTASPAGESGGRESAPNREAPKGRGEFSPDDIKRASQLPPLPPIPKEPGEADLIKPVRGYIGLLDKLSGNRISGGEAAELAAGLKELRSALLGGADPARLYMYKYPALSMAQLLFANGFADKLLDKDEYAFFYDGRENWHVGALERKWSVSGFEKGVYKVYFDPAFNTPAQIGRACRALLSIRESNAAEMLKIHREYGIKSGLSIFPLEPFRQLYTYSDYEGGLRQMESLSRICPEGTFAKPLKWLEIGYGTGKIFGPLSEVLAEGSVIYGTDLDGFCKDYARRVMESGVSDWTGKIELRDGEIESCCMPENSVDIVHGGHIHLGENYQKKDWNIDVNMLTSIKKALKPGGLLLIDDGGVPDLATLRKVMSIFGFEEIKVYTEPHTDPEHPIFMASYRNKK